MNALPQSTSTYRSPRARLDLTPAVLRLRDGRNSRGEIRLVSLTGGLLSLSRPLDQGSCVKLMFMTQAGTVQGSAEMLPAVSWGLQPFRFVSIAEGDQSKLRDVVESSLRQRISGDEWLDKYRAKLGPSAPPRRRLSKKILAALAVAALGGAAICARMLLT